VNETQVTLVGNIGGGDPELRFTPSGVAVAKFRMACTPRKRGEGEKWVDGESSWFSVTVWRQQAENVVESLRNGDRVIVQGNLQVRPYEDKEGVKRLSVEVDATSIGVELTFARAMPVKVAKSGGNGESSSGGDDGWGGASKTRPAQQQAQPKQQTAASDDPWA